MLAPSRGFPVTIWERAVRDTRARAVKIQSANTSAQRRVEQKRGCLYCCYLTASRCSLLHAFSTETEAHRKKSSPLADNKRCYAYTRSQQRNGAIRQRMENRSRPRERVARRLPALYATSPLRLVPAAGLAICNSSIRSGDRTRGCYRKGGLILSSYRSSRRR